MTAVLFGAASGLFFGLMAVLVRMGLRRGGHVELGVIVACLTGVAICIAAAAANGDLSRIDLGQLWRFYVPGMLVPGISQVLFNHSIRLAGPSRSAIVIGTAPLLSAVIAIIFLDEPLRAGLAIGTVLIVAGGIALTGERTRPEGFRMVGVVVALVCATLFGIRDNLVRVAARDTHPPALLGATAALLGAITIIGLYAVAVRRRELRMYFLRTVPAFAPAGVSLGLAYAALVEGFDRARVTVIAPLNATQSLWGIVFSLVLLGQAERIGRRTLAACALVVAGAVLISATR